MEFHAELEENLAAVSRKVHNICENNFLKVQYYK